MQVNNQLKSNVRPFSSVSNVRSNNYYKNANNKDNQNQVAFTGIKSVLKNAGSATWNKTKKPLAWISGTLATDEAFAKIAGNHVVPAIVKGVGDLVTGAGSSVTDFGHFVSNNLYHFFK